MEVRTSDADNVCLFFVAIWNVDEQEIVESIISRLAG